MSVSPPLRSLPVLLLLLAACGGGGEQQEQGRKQAEPAGNGHRATSVQAPSQGGVMWTGG